ncbi:MAG: mechanosensitive ion channel family protein [Polyangiaceae bacterium]
MQLRVVASFVVATAFFCGHARADEHSASVRLKDSEVFVLHRGRAGVSLDERSQRASHALNSALDDDSQPRVEQRGNLSVVYLGNVSVVEIDSDDARAAGDGSARDQAIRLSTRVREALQRERRRQRIASSVFSISLVVLFGLLTVFLTRRVAQLSNRIRTILSEQPERVPAVKIYSLELLSPSSFRNALTVLSGGFKWLAQLTLLYAWLVVSLSLFQSTQALTSRLTGALLVPLSQFATRLFGSLPVVAAVAVVGLAVVLSLRFTRLFFASVASGEIRTGWIAADTARTVGRLVQTGIVLATLVFVAPVLTGDDSGALSLAGWMLTAMLGLSAVPVLATILAGTAFSLIHGAKIGDWLEVGGAGGRVEALTPLDVRLRADEATVLRVPYLLTLVRVVRVRAERLVRATCAAPWSVDTDGLVAHLKSALVQVGTSPTVELLPGSGGLDVVLTVTSADPDAQTRLLNFGSDAVAAFVQKSENAP